MSFSLDFFSNERYKLLKIIYDNRVDIKKDAYATLSQQEIADIAHISKLKANRIINELINAGFVYYYNNKRGKYAVSDIGHRAMELIEAQHNEIQ